MTFPMNFPPMFGGLLPVFPGRPLVASGAPIGGAMSGISAAGAAPSMSVAASHEAGGARAKRKKRRHGSVKRGVDRPARRKANVVMGIDFGTAFTKIAIRAPYEPDGMDIAYAVEFCKIPGNPCMLLSAVWIDEDGYCWVEKGPGRKEFPGIKVAVIDPPNPSGPSIQALARAAAYLGIVIRGARLWFEKQKRLGKNVDLDWRYQIGIPAETARGDLGGHYSRLVNAALALSESPKISLRAAEKEIERDQGSSPVDCIPEVIAQAYGYIREPTSAEGIHVMVDAGAWTLDVCSFIHQVDETRLDLQAASVKPRGCINFHQTRMNAVGRAIMPNPFDALPEPEEYWRRIEQNNAAVIRRADKVFRDECAGIIGGVLAVALQQSRKMIERGGLPVMICGGGANIPLFKKAARQGWDAALKARQASAVARFPSLPKYRLIGREIDEKNIHRFSVAWGLSYPDLHYRLKIAPPPPLPQSDYRSRYIGMEQM